MLLPIAAVFVASRSGLAHPLDSDLFGATNIDRREPSRQSTQSCHLTMSGVNENVLNGENRIGLPGMNALRIDCRYRSESLVLKINQMGSNPY